MPTKSKKLPPARPVNVLLSENGTNRSISPTNSSTALAPSSTSATSSRSGLVTWLADGPSPGVASGWVVTVPLGRCVVLP